MRVDPQTPLHAVIAPHVKYINNFDPPFNIPRSAPGLTCRPINSHALRVRHTHLTSNSRSHASVPLVSRIFELARSGTISLLSRVHEQALPLASFPGFVLRLMRDLCGAGDETKIFSSRSQIDLRMCGFADCVKAHALGGCAVMSERRL